MKRQGTVQVQSYKTIFPLAIPWPDTASNTKTLTEGDFEDKNNDKRLLICSHFQGIKKLKQPSPPYLFPPYYC